VCSTTTNDLGLTATDHNCTCSTGAHSPVTAPISADAIREHYLVEGMTCNHCVSSITEELTALDGVDSVSVDLNAGGTSRVMIVSGRPIPVEAVRAAVTEAGYELAESRG
jgi:copper chaperone